MPPPSSLNHSRLGSAPGQPTSFHGAHELAARKILPFLIDLIAWTVTVGQVIHDRTFVGVRPGVRPHERDIVSGVNGNMGRCGHGTLVTDDIWTLIASRIDRSAIVGDAKNRPADSAFGMWVAVIRIDPVIPDSTSVSSPPK